MAKEMKNELKVTPAIIQAHIDVIGCLHYPIADSPENRKKFEEYICSVCSKIRCTGRGRCKATATTMAQINLLTGLVTFRDEGSPELGIEGFDRIVTIGDALAPFNPVLSDYLKEESRQELHVLICLAKKEGTSLGTLIIPKDYNIKTEKVFDMG